MKVKYLTILLIVAGTMVISCNRDELFEREQYKKTFALISDDEYNIFFEEHDFRLSTSPGFISAGCSGTLPTEKDIKMTLIEDENLLKEYNLINFDVDESKYARRLPAANYTIDDYSLTIPAGERNGVMSLSIHPQRLSPDSVYFLPLSVYAFSAYEMNSEKGNILYRVYVRNYYATQRTSTYYNMRGQRNIYDGSGYVSIMTSKRFFPVGENSVRTMAGEIAYEANVDVINRGAMLLTVDGSNKVKIESWKDLKIKQVDGDINYPNTFHIYDDGYRTSKVFLLRYDYVDPETGRTCSMREEYYLDFKEKQEVVNRLNVSRTALNMYVGGSVQLTATSYGNTPIVWESENPSVVGVTQSGLVTATGNGRTDIVVKSGGAEVRINTVVSTFVPVTSIETSHESLSLYMGETAQLSASATPSNISDSTLFWSSANSNVVTIDEYGAVKAISGGTTNIIASYGEFQKLIPVVVPLPLADVAGYWQFEDSLNLGKAITGTELVISGTVTQVDGPTDDNKCIQGTKYERNLIWNHDRSPVPTEFTIMWDGQYPGINQPGTNQYYAAYWNGTNTDASWFVRWRDDNLYLGRGNNVAIDTYADSVPAPWRRIMFVVKDNKYSAYVGGTKVMENMAVDNTYMWSEGVPLYFLSDGGAAGPTGGDGEDNGHPLAALAVWDRALTEEEITYLGGVKAEE
jgi:hypothetical protein